LSWTIPVIRLKGVNLILPKYRQGGVICPISKGYTDSWGGAADKWLGLKAPYLGGPGYKFGQ